LTGVWLRDWDRGSLGSTPHHSICDLLWKLSLGEAYLRILRVFPLINFLAMYHFHFLFIFYLPDVILAPINVIKETTTLIFHRLENIQSRIRRRKKYCPLWYVFWLCFLSAVFSKSLKYFSFVYQFPFNESFCSSHQDL